MSGRDKVGTNRHAYSVFVIECGGFGIRGSIFNYFVLLILKVRLGCKHNFFACDFILCQLCRLGLPMLLLG